MFPPGLEPGTFRVWGERDNRYTTETDLLETMQCLMKNSRIWETQIAKKLITLIYNSHMDCICIMQSALLWKLSKYKRPNKICLNVK